MYTLKLLGLCAVPLTARVRTLAAVNQAIAEVMADYSGLIEAHVTDPAGATTYQVLLGDKTPRAHYG